MSTLNVTQELRNEIERLNGLVVDLRCCSNCGHDAGGCRKYDCKNYSHWTPKESK